MSLGLYDPDRRYRRRIWARIARTGLFLATIGATSALAYQIGVEQMRGRHQSLEQEVETLRAEKVDLQQTAIRLEAATRTAEVQYQELLARFEREVPSGAVRCRPAPDAAARAGPAHPVRPGARPGRGSATGPATRRDLGVRRR